MNFVLKFTFKISFINFVFILIIKGVSLNPIKSINESYFISKTDKLLQNSLLKSNFTKENVTSTRIINHQTKSLDLLKVYNLNGKSFDDYINLYTENFDKKNYLKLIHDHLGLLNLIGFNFSIYKNDSDSVSSFQSKNHNVSDNLDNSFLNYSIKKTTTSSKTNLLNNYTTNLNFQRITNKINTVNIVSTNKYSNKTSDNYMLKNKLPLSITRKIDIFNNESKKNLNRNEKENIVPWFSSKIYYSNVQLTTRITKSKIDLGSSNLNTLLNENTPIVLKSPNNTKNSELKLFTTKIIPNYITKKGNDSIKSKIQNNVTQNIRYTNSTYKILAVSKNTTKYTNIKNIYINDMSKNSDIFFPTKKEIIFHFTKIPSRLKLSSLSNLSTLKGNSTNFTTTTIIRKNYLIKNSTSTQIQRNSTIISNNVSSSKINEKESFNQSTRTNVPKLSTQQKSTLREYVSTSVKKSSLLSSKSYYTTKNTLFTSNLLLTDSVKKLNKLIINLDDYINICPKSLENYCLNDGECYLKLYESNFLNLLEKLHGVNFHSAMPNCKCRNKYDFNGLIMLSYSGLRCEIITHTFTYLSMGLVIIILVSIILLIILFALLFKIIFVCYQNIKKRKEISNLSFSTSSLDYDQNNNDVRAKNNFQNYLNNKLEWLRKFEFPSVRNSWKYIKMNKSNEQDKQINNKKFGNMDSDNQNLYLNLKNYVPQETVNIQNSMGNEMHNKKNLYYKKSRNNNLRRKNQNYKSVFNNENNLQRYMTRRSRRLLKNILYNSNNKTSINDENYLFLNRNLRNPLSRALLSNTLSSNYSSVSLNTLENMCKSNICIYPKPSRISVNSNRFTSSNPDQEVTILNGALYY